MKTNRYVRGWWRSKAALCRFCGAAFTRDTNVEVPAVCCSDDGCQQWLADYGDALAHFAEDPDRLERVCALAYGSTARTVGEEIVVSPLLTGPPRKPNTKRPRR